MAGIAHKCSHTVGNARWALWHAQTGYAVGSGSGRPSPRPAPRGPSSRASGPWGQPSGGGSGFGWPSPSPPAAPPQYIPYCPTPRAITSTYSERSSYTSPCLFAPSTPPVLNAATAVTPRHRSRHSTNDHRQTARGQTWPPKLGGRSSPWGPPGFWSPSWGISGSALQAERGTKSNTMWLNYARYAVISTNKARECQYGVLAWTCRHMSLARSTHAH